MSPVAWHAFPVPQIQNIIPGQQLGRRKVYFFIFSLFSFQSFTETDSTKIPEKSDHELFPSPNETSNVSRYQKYVGATYISKRNVFREHDSKKNVEPLLKPTC